MSIKPHFETYRYTTQLCKTGSQSIVECRLPGGEIAGVLAIYAKAVPAECVCADGEVRYNGKLFLSVVYEDADRKVCRAERGAEFSHRAENPAVTPACFARAAFRTDNVSWRREGSGLYISVIVGADIDPKAIEIARENAQRAGVDDVVRFEVASAMWNDGRPSTTALAYSAILQLSSSFAIA